LILDSSAIVAIVCREQGYERILEKIENAQTILIGAPTVAETELTLTVKLGRDANILVEEFLAVTQTDVAPFTREHVSAFFEGFLRFGKGRHAARLNMGDCFTYAIAKVAGMPVLLTGNDFSQTDIMSA
jgi:ribonuclease VapC